MTFFRKILSICVISAACASDLFAHDVSILPFQSTATVFYDNYIRDTVKFTYPIQTIYKDQNDNYIAILKDGTELDVTQRLSNAGHTLIEDSEGNQMAVTGDQQLMSAEQYHNTGKNNTLIKSDNERKDKQIAASGDVIFKPSESQQFGFDAYDASTNNHPEIYPPLEDGSYRPAYKSVAQWQQDKVAADPMQGVTFRNQMGAPYATTSGDIILRGEPQPGETPVYAHVAETDSTTKVVGKLNLLTFEPREISVCLVPVNGATPPNAQTLEKELNKIFKPAVASVKLSTHSGITIDYANGSGFVHGGSGPLTVYSDDEKAAINALTDANDDTYYLFLVSSVTKLDADGNNTVVSGYMPVGYQHGFIFEQFDVARTFAHELSHGAFALHHTFSANTESFRADEGTTNNLMDYTRDGIALNHKQWRWMHENHGKGLFGFLADESEGEFNENDALVAEILKAIHDANANQESHCTIEVKGFGFESHNYPLGEEKIDIEIAKRNFSDLTIDCDKNSCATETSDFAFEKEGSFIKFKFPLYSDNKTSDALEILVDEKYADVLAVYLFAREIDISDRVTHYSQFDEIFSGCTCWPNQCCYKACMEMLESVGQSTSRVNQVIAVDYSNINDIVPNENAEKVIQIIDNSLFKHKLPILIGVHHPNTTKNTKGEIVGYYEALSSNSPQITNHFVVIVGKKYDKSKKLYYYYFYEAGTSVEEYKKSDDNKLYIYDNNLIKGTTGYRKSEDNYYYIVTEVRKNNNQVYEYEAY